jgi:paraquat-inducible protein B
MSKEKSFEQLSKEKRSSLLREFWEFLKHNKKWWLLPIIAILLGLGLLVLLSSSAIAPFIYPLF